MRTAADRRPERAVTVSDGYVGLNINPRKAGRHAGLDHFGVEVEDAERVCARLRERYPAIEVLKRPDTRPFAGISTHDPAGNLFDLSQKDMGNRTSVYVEPPREQARTISHLALRTLHADEVAEFYVDLLGFEQLAKKAGDPNHYLSDGRVTLILMPWSILDYEAGGRVAARGVARLLRGRLDGQSLRPGGARLARDRLRSARIRPERQPRGPVGRLSHALRARVHGCRAAAEGASHRAFAVRAHRREPRPRARRARARGRRARHRKPAAAPARSRQARCRGGRRRCGSGTHSGRYAQAPGGKPLRQDLDHAGRAAHAPPHEHGKEFPGVPRALSRARRREEGIEARVEAALAAARRGAVAASADLRKTGPRPCR